eukprot:TRINITY_DN3728_c0_g1_i4.p1 TRINITY_DN3728_c0_g1~~TRINITY_DN3728_c0_g1_i4.p1  ORF type:complete len:182 (-),score=29.12 TRINITY_DN3728_c0_g1_i4:255-800(-)
MIRRPPRSTLSSSSAASDVYKRQGSMLSHDQDNPTSCFSMPLLFKIRLAPGSSSTLFERLYHDSYGLHKITGQIHNPNETSQDATAKIEFAKLYLAPDQHNQANQHLNKTGDLSMFGAIEAIHFDGSQTSPGKIEGTWKLDDSLGHDTKRDWLATVEGNVTSGSFSLSKLARVHGMGQPIQ